ncbi:T9SS type A sorting domain-containing protein [Hymenobacter elongatus]|uniref:T9SS type A sorting domain-containing protein n=1 Tax=Hymenobacter elongatus TaxID=877208 RepID=A0A4Z0PF91_9BACT|nr:T9SS type A sorting domain-containing protein [Hymenobacter elongatus]TGE13785.1 T9SS type A sorting domain-containing protein [Hymenobacter elongatus]
MKNSTRLFLLLPLLLLQLSAFATTYTITVGDNFYSPEKLDIKLGDEVIWKWQSGNHPTASDNAAWVTFQMNSSSQTKSITFNTLGTFAYHCTAHAFFDNGSWKGMIGSISVKPVTTAAEARLVMPTLSVYPNPSKGMVLVSLGQKAGESYKLRLSNIIGREVRMVALKPETDAEGVPVNLSDLPAGVYFYSLLVNDKVVTTKRLILQN